MGIFHQRHLPHFQPPNGTFFTTFRLTGSIPFDLVEQLREEYLANQRHIADIDEPQERAQAWRKLQQEYFEIVDHSLDDILCGPRWLQRCDIATVVVASIHYAANTMFDLHAYTIMPNHVHLCFSIGNGSVGRRDNPASNNWDEIPHPVSEICGSIKKYSARRANHLLGRKGPFWQDETYDRFIRDIHEFRSVLWYIIQNPVRAGLVTDWHEWPWIFCDEESLCL